MVDSWSRAAWLPKVLPYEASEAPELELVRGMEARCEGRTCVSVGCRWARVAV